MTDQTIVAHIFAGEYVLSEGFHKLAEMIVNLPGVGGQLFSLRSEFEKLKVLESVFPERMFHQLLDETYAVLRKKESLAKLFKESGDKFLKESNLTLALRSYNLATLFIPGKNKDIGALFAQRASALLQAEKTSECLCDIETAYSFTLSQELQESLVEMKLKCLELKSDPDSAEEVRKQDKRDYCSNVMFNISANQNPKLQSGSEFIKVVSEKEKGRYVVTTKDLDPGVTVIVETPYATVQNDICLWNLKRCSRCFKKIAGGVRCRKCVFNIYCSDVCRREDFYNGHQYECKCLAFLHSMRLPAPIHLCLKIICKTGPEVLYGCYQRSKDKAVDTKTDEIKGFDPKTGIFCSDSYHAVRNMISHDLSDEIPAITVPWLGLTMVRTLAYKTQFFSGIKESEKSGFMTFVANELMFHCHSVSFNTFGLFDHSDEIPDGGDEKMARNNRSEIGSGVYPLTSLMNTGCDPTAFRVNLPNGKMSIMTNRKMKAGDEVIVSYGYIYTMDELSDRQSKLKNAYRFTCQCFACLFDWPMEKNMKPKLEFICPKCCGSFEYRNTEEAKKRVLNLTSETKGLCKTCGVEYEMHEMRKEALDIKIQLDKAQDFVKAGMLVEAIPLLIEWIQFCQTKILFPNASFLQAQEVFRKCHLRIIEESTC